MGRKAAWQDWKKEKKGGVHFSFGGGYAFPLYYEGLAGGVAEVAFGGLFSHYVGMEVKYRTIINQNAEDWFQHFLRNADNPVSVGRAQTLQHSLSLGLIFNTSKKRVRPYFTISGGMDLLSIDARGVASESPEAFSKKGTIRSSTKLGLHFSPGFGIDFKIPKYGSFFVAGEVSMHLFSFGVMDFYPGSGNKISLFNRNFSTSEISVPITIGFRFSRW